MDPRHAMLWRRLDAPGHDACRIEQRDGGWLINGAAVFRHRREPAWVRYQVWCNADWRTLRCQAEGFAAGNIGFEIQRISDRWLVDGVAEPGFDGVSDVDLGFTPATNVIAIRRLALEVGASAAVAAVWFDIEDGRFKLLHQHYERLSADRYRCASPSHGYEAILAVDAFGCVTDYPELWRAEPSGEGRQGA